MGDGDSVWSGVLKAWGDMAAEARITLILVLFTAGTLFFQYQREMAQTTHYGKLTEIFTRQAASDQLSAEAMARAADATFQLAEETGDYRKEFAKLVEQRLKVDDELLKYLKAGNLLKTP